MTEKLLAYRQIPSGLLVGVTSAPRSAAGDRVALRLIAMITVFSFPVAASSAPDNLDAVTIYQQSCSVCHGDDGTGAIWGQESLAMPPRDFTSELSRQELTRARMIASVTHGRPGSPMPGFGTQLNPSEVEAIVDYIRVRFMSAQASSTPGKGAITSPGVGSKAAAEGAYHELPFPGGLSGRFDRGQVLYIGNCVVCHGLSGAGDGPRAYFIVPRPRNFLDPATQQILNRPTLYRGIRDGVIGREMPAWSKVMDDQDIVDIAEYVYRQFIRSGQDRD